MVLSLLPLLKSHMPKLTKSSGSEVWIVVRRVGFEPTNLCRIGASGLRL